MAQLSRRDVAAVTRGAAAQLAVALPPVLVVRTLVGPRAGTDSYLPVLAISIAVVVAPAAGATVVVAARTATPVAHALGAALLAWTAHTTVTLLRTTAASVLIPSPFIGLVEAAVAAATAHLITSRRRQPAP